MDQYDQQVNQVQAKRVEKPIYSTNERTSNTFGLEPNYGCCTANLHQGWPKFVEYGLWARDDDGLICLAYSPCSVSTNFIVDGKHFIIKIDEKTNYPFSNTISFTIHLNEVMKFALKLRIPEWAINASIQINQDPLIKYESGIFANINRNWNDKDKIQLKIPAELKFETRYNGAKSIIREPLIFSYNPEEEHLEMKKNSKAQLLRKNSDFDIPSQVKDWEIIPKSPWQYALVEPLTAQIIEHPENIENFQCFDNNRPPLTLKIKGVEISNWELEYEAAEPPPSNPIAKTGRIMELNLIPYGCTNLRITEFPVFKNN